MAQYTIRNVPEAVDRELRETARKRGISLNEAALAAMRRGLGVSEILPEYHDLDDLIGTWKDDPEFEEAISNQDTVDRELWQ